jgi:hypothetical protein
VNFPNFAPHGPRLDTTYLCRALTSGGREQRGHSPINLNRRIGSLPQGALSEMEAAIQPARFTFVGGGVESRHAPLDLGSPCIRRIPRSRSSDRPTHILSNLPSNLPSIQNALIFGPARLANPSSGCSKAASLLLVPSFFFGGLEHCSAAASNERKAIYSKDLPDRELRSSARLDFET